MREHDLDINDFILDEIESIELMGDMECIDIEVEDTHMFYANDIYTHNSADESDIITGNQIAEAWSKLFIADFVVSLSRKMTDKVAGTGRWHIIKNRFGQDGLTFPSKINFSCGKIDIYDDNSISGKEVKQQMNNSDEYMRKLYKRKYDDNKNQNLEDDDNATQNNSITDNNLD